MSVDRFEFTITQKREMAARSHGVCEAGKFGTRKFYGMADKDICHMKGQEFDHIIADGLHRMKPLSIEEGLHVCKAHHAVKTHKHDRPAIQKAKNIREKNMGVTKPKKLWPKRGAWVDNSKDLNGNYIRDADT